MTTPVQAPSAQEHYRNQENLSGEENRWVDEALARDKREGLKLSVRARWVALAVISVLLPIINPRPEVIYFEFLLCLFALVGWAQLKIGTVGLSRSELFLMFCDLALMTVTLCVPNPLRDTELPLAMQYRTGNFMYFYVLLAGATLAYSWRTVIAMGVWTAGMWLMAFAGIWLVFTPDPEITQATAKAFGTNQRLLEALDPNNLQFTARIQEIVVFAIVAGMLGLAAHRSHRLLMSQASAERERTNLARYFSPNVVDELSHNDEPLKHVRSQNVAVLFVDIVGFTEFAASRSPEQTIEILREFHGRMEREVFSHEGTLDKYLGDGLMATFGTPATTPDDALNAFMCVRAMISAIENLNRERHSSNEPSIRASFGLHYGPVVLGDIGTNRLEFAVIGNTVNIASRLEALTRKHDAIFIASEAAVQAMSVHSVEQSNVLEGLERIANQGIRGAADPMPVWMLGTKAA